MSSTSERVLDDVELVHLALHAMRNERHDEALNLLKRTVHTYPGNANAHYLLGAEHAQIGLYDRAIEEMAEAVRLDPALAAAHFQLGLLHLTGGRPREAEAAWKPLDELAAHDALRLFKSGLLHLTRDEFAECITNLEAGIANNRLNEALNDDMRRVLSDLQARRLGADGTKQRETDPPAAAIQVPLPSKRLLLSTYDQNRDDS